MENLEKVNEIIANSLMTGGKETIAMIDGGFIQVRSIKDLDGHIWSVLYLGLKKFKEMKSNRN